MGVKSLSLVEVSKSFGVQIGLDNVSLEVPSGALVAVVGPSGCGKTTLLKVIAGLLTPDSGQISIGGIVVDGLPAAERQTAMVFQSDTLFPDLTIRQNVAFGLGPRSERNDEIVDVALLRFGITGAAHRFPQELSGGQRRRAALARALVTRPAVLLLDEPLSGLDRTLGTKLSGSIRDAQRRFGATALLVTHDLDDALARADLIVVMRDGRIEQIGTPREVYNHPRSAFVASFIGAANLFDVEGVSAAGGRWRVSALGCDHLVSGAEGIVDSGLLLVRPEAIGITPEQSTRSWTEVSGRVGIVSEILFHGPRTDYLVETENGMVVATSFDPGDEIEVGEGVSLIIDASRAWLLPRR